MLFRRHTEVPDVPACATITALLYEWVSINRSLEFTRQVQRMDPLFAVCITPGDVVDLIDRSTQEDRNKMLYVLARSDSYLAHRILLQALLPRLLRIALRRSWRTGHIEDHLQDCISDFWTTCANYPEKSTTSVDYNLVRTPYTPHPSVTDTVAFDSIVEEIAELPQPEQHDTNAGDRLDQLFQSALDNGAVAEEDLELLRLVYLEEYTSHEVAEQMGVSPAFIRKRCQRIRQRLAKVTV